MVLPRNYPHPCPQPYNTPSIASAQSLPFSDIWSEDKLKAEFNLLKNQGIIAPVTEPTEW